MLLRHDVGRHELRMNLGGDAYLIQAARLDTAGIAFEAEQIAGVSRWQEGGKLAPAPLPSPVTWEQITSIERRDSGWRRGALIGLLVLPVAVYVAQSQDDTEGWAGVFAINSAPFGALAGGLIGALGSAWVPVWQRPVATGEGTR